MLETTSPWSEQIPYFFRASVKEEHRLLAGRLDSAGHSTCAVAAGEIDGFTFISSRGYTRSIGEADRRISVGRAQRIARRSALLLRRSRRPIMDEATSALDPRSGSAVLERFAVFFEAARPC